MTEHDDELLELAHPYALDALDAPARAEVEARLARADPASRAEIESIVTEVREKLAKLGGGESSMFSSHPGSSDRAANMRTRLAAK